MYRILLLIFFLLPASLRLSAQADAFSGVWETDHLLPDGSSVKMQLNIALPEKNVFYPAHLAISSNRFSAEYELLLVRKNTRELGISRNKFPLFEKPFSLGNATTDLNGTFDLSKDLKGNPILVALRLPSKQMVAMIRDTVDMYAANKRVYFQLNNFLKLADIRLKKTSSIPWGNKDQERIVQPSLSPAYFGIRDTLYLPTRDGSATFSGTKKKANDIVSVTLNGQLVLDQVQLNKKKYSQDILLSPGVNTLVLFADNFANELPNAGKLHLEFGNKKFNLDFTNPKDSAATFIVVKLVCDPDQSKERYFQENTLPGEEKNVGKDEKFIGSIISTSRQLTFAIWDEVINDGDSISIKINGQWLVQGCPVQNIPRFITVTLQPGANTIVFMADNLGSIPPNTSALEIIDGKRRKYYAMETRPGEKNLVKIFYDTKSIVQ